MAKSRRPPVAALFILHLKEPEGRCFTRTRVNAPIEAGNDRRVLREASTGAISLTAVAVHDQPQYRQSYSHAKCEETESHTRSPFMETMPTSKVNTKAIKIDLHTRPMRAYVDLAVAAAHRR